MLGIAHIDSLPWELHLWSIALVFPYLFYRQIIIRNLYTFTKNGGG
jgi:hypothetical protein